MPIATVENANDNGSLEAGSAGQPRDVPVLRGKPTIHEMTLVDYCITLCM